MSAILTDYLTRGLREDIQTGDVTSCLLIPDDREGDAVVVAKESGVFFGSDIAHAMVELYPRIQLTHCVDDGRHVSKHDECCRIQGNMRDILLIERTLLNFLQRLSGIASVTHQYVTALNDPRIDVLDTRKTTPMFRWLEKQAVRAGGGVNHRHGLHDMVLVKENHLRWYVQHNQLSLFHCRLSDHRSKLPSMPIEVEVNDLDVLMQLEGHLIDTIMLDNMTREVLLVAIEWIREQAPSTMIEVSGNVTVSTISQYRGMGIDRISVGSLTHSVRALDLSLLVQ